MGLLSHCVIYTLKDERQMKKVDMKNKKYAEGFSLKQPQGWQANVVDEEYIIYFYLFPYCSYTDNHCSKTNIKFFFTEG